MNKLPKLKHQLEVLQNKIKELEAKQEAEKSKVSTIIIDKIEYETKEHNFNKQLKHIVIPKGWRLWTAEECIKLHNSHKEELNLDICWFYIEQPFTFNKNYVAGFVANSGWAGLGCDWNPTDADASLGVRFCREVKK